MSGAPERLGVVGAGTMGSGIAQLGCLAGMRTLLHDPDAAALEEGAGRLRAGLAKGAERGRWSEAEARSAEKRLRSVATLEELEGCDLVVEAAPERLELKRELFERLSEICGEDCLLATNTSSILVASVAGAARRPENVLGLHFFNPPPLMPLVEVIAAARTSSEAVDAGRATAEAMGRTPIVALDGPGFLVNRCGRPFGSEALRLLQERVAEPAQIDRVCRLGGGFRMGPFELMDLVGIDVGLEVAESFDAQSYGEPRWRPSALQARMVAAGRLGRKSGEGWYSYGDGPYRDDDPSPVAIGGGDGRLVAIEGAGPLARELRERATRAGFDVREPAALGAEAPELVVDAGVPAASADLALLSDRSYIGLGPEGPPLLTVCAERSLATRGEPAACGFNLVPPLGEEGGLAELARLPTTSARAAEEAERFLSRSGLHAEWVGDAPGLVLGRIVAGLVNEAAFAIGEGVGSAADVDAGTTLGLSHPRGPVEWGELIGLDHVLATIDGLWEERREERYRAAPLLRRAVAAGQGLAATAEAEERR